MRKSAEAPNLLAELGYETTDVSVRGVMIGLVALFAFVLLSCGVTIGLYKIFEPEYVHERDKPAFAAARQLPPAPQLQTRPRQELTAYHEATDAAIGNSIQKAKDAAVAAGIAGVRESGAATGGVRP